MNQYFQIIWQKSVLKPLNWPVKLRLWWYIGDWSPVINHWRIRDAYLDIAISKPHFILQKHFQNKLRMI
jgi:hypothetical protein